ncbi:hypothetical protein ACOSQ3_025179 [Xanthoceras sorbifolium]
MATRNQSNADFRNEVHEILGRHESSIDEVHTTLQTVLTEIQSLRALQNQSQNQPETNPFASTESSQHIHLASANDPQGWIYKAKQFFEFKDVAADLQVQIASFHLESIALQWHRWYAKFKGPVTWTEFTKALLLRFGPIDYEDPSEALTRLKQTSTVSIYQEEFEKLFHRVDELPEKFLIGCFIAGLKDEVRLDVKIKQPRSLTDAIGVARLVEEKNSLQKRGASAFRPSILVYDHE